MTLSEYIPQQGYRKDQSKSENSNIAFHQGDQNWTSNQQRLFPSSSSGNATPLYAMNGTMENHFSQGEVPRPQSNHSKQFVQNSHQQQYLQQQLIQGQHNQHSKDIYSSIPHPTSVSTDTEDECVNGSNSQSSWKLDVKNPVGHPASTPAKQEQYLHNLNFSDLSISSGIGNSGLNSSLHSLRQSSLSRASSATTTSYNSSFHTGFNLPNEAFANMVPYNDANSIHSSTTSMASVSTNLSASQQMLTQDPSSQTKQHQQQHIANSSKRVNKWKKNKKKYEEQQQLHEQQKKVGTETPQQRTPATSTSTSTWTQQHQNNLEYQWPTYGGTEKQTTDSIGNVNASMVPPPLLSRNVSNSSKSTMSTHFEEVYANEYVGNIAISQSFSSTNSSPHSIYNNATSLNSNAYNVTQNMSSSTFHQGKSNLSSKSAVFFPSSRSAGHSNTASPYASMNVPNQNSNTTSSQKKVQYTTNVLAAANAVASSSSGKNKIVPATHTTRASGELSSLRRQVELKQKTQMMLISNAVDSHNQQQNQFNNQWGGASTTSMISFDEMSGQSSFTASTMGNSQGGNLTMPSIMPSSYDMNSIGEESEYTSNAGSIDYSVSPNSARSAGAQLAHQTPKMKKREWLVRMNRRLNEIPVGKINPDTLPITAIMNAWAKTKSAEGADMVEMWLKRVKQDKEAGNDQVEITTKMYTMAVDAWAKSGEKGAAKRAESILHDLNQSYQESGHDESLKPTTGIFNAVINAWARSGEKIAPQRAEQIFEWMEKLCARGNYSIKPDKYTFNTVIHAYAKFGGKEAAIKAQQLLKHMHRMHIGGNSSAKPDTITYNVVINCLAKSGGKGAALEAEKLLSKMHMLHDAGDTDVKPNVVTYGAVIDAWAKSGETGAAGRADNILATMIQLHQNDPVKNADLRPNTYTFNTVINAWAKSKEQDAASKAEEMLVAMGRLHACGIPGLKPDAFTYTAVIDAWAKSGYRGAAARADQLLDKMEAQYQAGDFDLKPNTFTYNAVINALAKSGEPGAAARAERVLHNMVKRHRQGGMNDDVKPTTINFNTVLDAWAKTGGKGAAQRAEEILEWMDHLNKSGNADVKPDTITFNAVIDAWARSGDKRAPIRAEQILDHMDDLYQVGNKDVKPDTYTYNTVINAWAKSGERGSAARAEQILAVMERRYKDGDRNFKPNTRTHTSVIDAWAKSGERGAASRAEHILNTMQTLYESKKDPDIKPNAHTCNAVMNACAFTKTEEDRAEALEIAFRVFDWLSSRSDMHPDAYTFTILLSVCSNLLPKEDEESRFTYARTLFNKCCEAGHVNHFVLRKLKQTVTEEEYAHLVGDGGKRDPYSDNLPPEWTRNAKNGPRNRRGNQWKSKGNHRRHH